MFYQDDQCNEKKMPDALQYKKTTPKTTAIKVSIHELEGVWEMNVQ